MPVKRERGPWAWAGFRVPPVGRRSTDATFEALTQGKIISLTQTGLLMEAARVSKPKCPGGLGTSEPMKTSGIHVSFRRRGAPTALNQAVTVLAQRPRDTVLPDNGLPRVGNRSLTVTAPLRALIIKVAPAAPGLPHSGPRRPTSSYPPEPSGPGENLAAVAIPAARQGPLPAR